MKQLQQVGVCKNIKNLSFCVTRLCNQYSIPVFQVKSSLLHEYVRLKMAEVHRRMMPPECMPLSKLSSYLHVTQQFYQFFGNLQPNLDQVIAVSDVDLFLRKKDKTSEFPSCDCSYHKLVCSFVRKSTFLNIITSFSGDDERYKSAPGRASAFSYLLESN